MSSRSCVHPEPTRFAANRFETGKFSDVAFSGPAISGRFDFHVNLFVKAGSLCHRQRHTKLETRLRINGRLGGVERPAIDAQRAEFVRESRFLDVVLNLVRQAAFSGFIDKDARAGRAARVQGPRGPNVKPFEWFE